MRPRCLTLPCLLTLLALMPSLGRALRPDILYLGSGKFVQVGPLHQLTLHAHVKEFAYEPTGQEIAVAGRETEGETATIFVETVDVRSGHAMNRLTMTAPVGDETARYNLIGWSGSGRYLLVERWLPVKEMMEEAAQGKPAPPAYLRWDFGANPPSVSEIALLPLPAGVRARFTYVRVSPKGHTVFFGQEYSQTNPTTKEDESHRLYSLYDPGKDQSRPLPLPAGFESYGQWLDADRLRIDGDGSQQHISETLDVVTGATAPYTDAPKTKPTSLFYPNLTLDTEARTLEDKKATGAQAASHILWLRRTNPGKDPMAASAAAVTSGDDEPRPSWSPTGKQIAYVTHGDLCVTDLTAPEEIPEERQALGLPLTCAEERQLARVNIKNVDMAMFWYSMRHDNRFPTAGEFQSEIAADTKYVNDLHTESVHFVYHEPPDRQRGHLEKQTELVIGEFDLPCARIVLMGDGTVKTILKPGASPEGAN